MAHHPDEIRHREADAARGGKKRITVTLSAEDSRKLAYLVKHWTKIRRADGLGVPDATPEELISCWIDSALDYEGMRRFFERKRRAKR